MKKTMILALLVNLSAIFGIAQNGAGEQELIRLQKEWRAAIERGDRDALDRFIADDFSNRAGWNKTRQIEQSLKAKERQTSRNIQNLTNTSFDYTVKFKGSDLAVMRFSVADNGQYKGQDFTNYRHRLLVWMKRGGSWQIVEGDSSPFTDEQSIKQIEREWVGALKKEDKAWLERTYADEYTAIGWNGKMRNKTEDIADTLLNTDNVMSDEISDMKVRVYGDTAIVVGRLHLAGKDKKGSFDRRYIFTDTFVKRDGRWQIVTTQSTLAAPKTTAKN